MSVEGFSSKKIVIAPFTAAYAAGLTPNPCAWCNAAVKFCLLLDAALERGAERLATGHYARLIEHPSCNPSLAKGVDQKKEQSYFLALVPINRLARSIFPLGTFTTAAVHASLAARRLTPPLPVKSQEICFVTSNDYVAFLKQDAMHRGISLPGPGPILFCNRHATYIHLPDSYELGQHRGLWRHTIGQRRGLGIPFTEPLYVVDKDVTTNTLYVGTRLELASVSCQVGSLNYLVPPEAWPQTIFVRTRYRQTARPAVTTFIGDILEIHFLAPRTLAAPGQIAAMYDLDGNILAGGIVL